MTHFRAEQQPSHCFSVAPMMDLTCPHGRYLMRVLAPHVRLYSEMLVDQSIIHGALDRLLMHQACEFPLAFQLASADPEKLARALRRLHAYTDDPAIAEINLNVGCPSPRVQAGGFGACLMKDPPRLFALVDAMRENARVPMSVKLRLGVDHHTGYDRFRRLIDGLAAHGCSHVIVHARHAWLKGVDPKKNRTLPKLDYASVHQLQAEKPEMRIILNGGLTSSTQCLEQLAHVSGVMIGRAAFQQPWLISELEHHLFGTPIPSLHMVLEKMLPYWDKQLMHQNARTHTLFRGAIHLVHGVSGAKRWRQALTEASHQKIPDLQALQRLAYTLMPQAA